MVTQMQPLQERDPNSALSQSSTGNEKTSKPQSQSNRNSNRNKKDNKAPLVEELSHIHLEGEEEEKVPIYDTCGDVRIKIHSHLKRPGMSQAAFCREISDLVPWCPVNQRQLAKFLRFKGPRGGGHSPAYYGAYVYFEKLRLWKGKAKSQKRVQMEEAWKSEGGVPREGSHNMALSLPAGDRWSFDSLGQIEIHGAPRVKGS